VEVGKVRFQPKTIGVEGIAHNHYTIRSTQFEWQTDTFKFYLNCVRTGVSLITSFFPLKHFSHFLLKHFCHWNISFICLTVVSKLTITVFF